MFLTNDIANWVKSYFDIIRMLVDPDSTQAIVDNFKALFYERFLSKIIKIISISFDIELSDLYQKPDELLSIYYDKMISLMRRIDVKDRFTFIFSFTSFTLLKSAILDIILRSFIRGLNDSKIRKKVTREMAPLNRFLRNIYNLTKKV